MQEKPGNSTTYWKKNFCNTTHTHTCMHAHAQPKGLVKRLFSKTQLCFSPLKNKNQQNILSISKGGGAGGVRGLQGMLLNPVILCSPWRKTNATKRIRQRDKLCTLKLKVKYNYDYLKCSPLRQAAAQWNKGLSFKAERSLHSIPPQQGKRG